MSGAEVRHDTLELMWYSGCAALMKMHKNMRNDIQQILWGSAKAGLSQGSLKLTCCVGNYKVLEVYLASRDSSMRAPTGCAGRLIFPDARVRGSWAGKEESPVVAAKPTEVI